MSGKLNSARNSFGWSRHALRNYSFTNCRVILFPIRINSKWKSDWNTNAGTFETCYWIFTIDRFESFDHRVQKTETRSWESGLQLRQRWSQCFYGETFVIDEIDIWIKQRREIWLLIFKKNYVYFFRDDDLPTEVFLGKCLIIFFFFFWWYEKLLREKIIFRGKYVVFIYSCCNVKSFLLLFEKYYFEWIVKKALINFFQQL